MIAGPLDRRITIERYSSTINDLGEEVGAWAPLATVWAAKTDIRDSERFVAQQVNSTITTRFRTRYLSKIADVDPKDRLIAAGRYYGIFSVKEIGRREGLEITAAARSDVVIVEPVPVLVRTDSRTVVTTPINHPVTLKS